MDMNQNLIKKLWMINIKLTNQFKKKMLNLISMHNVIKKKNKNLYLKELYYHYHLKNLILFNQRYKNIVNLVK